MNILISLNAESTASFSKLDIWANYLRASESEKF